VTLAANCVEIIISDFLMTYLALSPHTSSLRARMTL
jgi:hypothetical protein